MRIEKCQVSLTVNAQFVVSILESEVLYGSISVNIDLMLSMLALVIHYIQKHHRNSYPALTGVTTHK